MLERHIDDTPSAEWDPTVRELAEQVSNGLADRLRRMAIEEIVAKAVPCAHPYCRYPVLVFDGVPNHIFDNGSPSGPEIELPIPGIEGGVSWEVHDASPADERCQAELRAIVDGAVPCAHPHCDRNVALVDGVSHHIDDAGKLLGHRLSAPVPNSEGPATWVPHDADPAVDLSRSSPCRSDDPGGAEGAVA